jgi:hypothetical protein
MLSGEEEFQRGDDMDKEILKSLLVELFKNGEIEIKSEFNMTMDKSYTWVYIDKEPVYSDDPFFYRK